MSEIRIGDWVARRGTKWHRVESIVADAAITSCGRRMEPYLAGRTVRERIEVRANPPIDSYSICRNCE